MTPPISSTSLRLSIGHWVESSWVQRLIITLIIINAVTLGLETSHAVMTQVGHYLVALDHLILTVFVIELALKLLAQGWRFFRDPWNLFDSLVVGIALVPASGPLAVLRTLRVLRLLRLVSAVPRLRFIVESLLHAVPGIASIGGLMLLIFYVAAVMATGLFGDEFPDWFGSIGNSMYTLFQVMTLESWSMGIARPVMATHPEAWLFFIPFILIATFTMLNLFIAIIVNTMQTMHEADIKQEGASLESAIHSDSQLLMKEISSLRSELTAMRQELRQTTARGMRGE